MKKQVIFIFVIISILIACNNDDSNQSNDFNISEQLENIFDNGIIGQSNDFIAEAIIFQSLVDDFNENRTQENLEALQNAWRTLKLSWEPLEVLTFGVDVTLTNKIINIDLWPIDTEVINNNISQDEVVVDLPLIRTLGAQSKGLVSIEYLLFEDLEFFRTQEFSDNRMNYLMALALDIVNEAEDYKEVQLANEENFKSATSNSVSGTQNRLVNSMIFKLDEISTLEIGSSLGINTNGTINSLLTEDTYSQFSLENIEREIQQIETIFTGLYNENSTENGLYAQLIANDREDLVNELIVDFENIYSTIGSFSLSLEQQLDTDPTLAFNLIDAVTGLEITVKNDVASALNVVITFSDNDGD